MAKRKPKADKPVELPTFNVGDKVQHSMSNKVGTILPLGPYTMPDSYRVKFVDMNRPSDGIITHATFLRRIQPMSMDDSLKILTEDLKHQPKILANKLDIDPPGLIYQCKICLGTVSEVDGFIIGKILTEACKV